MIPILLVDDQESNLEALESMLASSGCRLERAQSADAALLALLQEDFAAVVLDVRMPGMSGFELAQLIRQRKRNRDLPILFLTAYSMDEADVLRGYEAGAVDYLTKPIHPSVVRSKIAVFAELYRQRRALAQANDALRREVEERQAAQDALGLANQELENRVAERTEALARANLELREFEQRRQIALDAAGMAWWIWDLEADRISWVPSPDHGDREGRDFNGPFNDLLTMIHPDDRSLMDDAVRQAIESSGDYRCEVRFLRPGQPPRWALVAGKVLEESGTARRIAGVDLDITDRKRAEQALREADRRKDEFLAMLAHELRNPLAPIGYAIDYMILKGANTPEMDWARNVISRQLKQMTRLVDDLLDVSRISRGKLELRRDVVDLQAILKDVCETSAPTIAERRIELHLDIPDSPLAIYADAVRMAQGFNNLLNNSAKYTEPGGSIWVTVRQPEDGLIEISVRDNGLGIPAPMLGRIFELFTQVDRTVERSQGGLGVGLTLVKTIVEMHGGSIEARSEGPGKGSEFIVRLKSHADRSMTGHLPHPPADGSERYRILVAEDVDASADGLRSLLGTMGHHVEVVYDGEAAIAAIEAQKPHVVILDLGMPRLNAPDAARRIRDLAWGRHVTLIALGLGQTDDRRRAQAVGFDHHFTKPVDGTALKAVLSSVPRRIAS